MVGLCHGVDGGDDVWSMAVAAVAEASVVTVLFGPCMLVCQPVMRAGLLQNHQCLPRSWWKATVAAD